MTMNVNTIGARRATLAAEVRSELERMIVAGELAAGEKLNEAVLANAMGVSRGTVREAIRSLADSGLIDLIANRGAYVHLTTLEEVRNLYELRGAIFAMACAAAARRVREGDERELIERLRHNLGTMEGVRDRDDREAYYTLNIAFHDMLLQAARNPKAKTMYDNLVREMHLFRRRGLSIATNIAQSLAEHGAIFAAVEAGDPEGAQRAAQEHIVAGFVRYTGMVEDHSPVERAAGT
ncbi:GntR family transcriptional regulator [Salinarimonas rosea]|uniref:GntR family transcriptional regulator n=1 Tax=Salinarimonas rosea TaxID=552063 RepID=UPI000693589F|nr:GntR family transcriptional regulator [Salinarimonas rosea]